ncbi:glutathione S-transferase family protein [Paraferrimonas sedimenticola]|uniref:glutathione transferase n=1 Tax=Paraferrimonas sedimenticola TaxID=375674 RepID=A0AA37RUG5_9GAMM|nr:glutathione S-transferase family protein [Paraferrimonas sedimenticola]GLP95388.1 glutathione S-transferase [Paraferrimonas sedimenticola]
MELLFCPECIDSQKVLLGLYEKLAQFRARQLDSQDPIDMAQVAQINPFGELPILRTDDEQTLVHSTIIIEFLDEEFQQGTQLIPHDPRLAREVRLLDRQIHEQLHLPLLSLQNEQRKPLPRQDRDLIRNSQSKIETALEQLELRLETNHWVVGDAFSLADCTLIPTLSLASSVYPFSTRHQLNRYWQQVKFRGSYQLLQQQLKDMKGFKNPFIAQ